MGNTSSTKDAALDYARRGWAPVPIPHGEKNPNLRGWQNLRIGPAEVPRQFNGRPQNIGVVLGEPSGYLVDLDLDALEALAAAAYLAPDTPAVFGRASKPRSHRLYVAEGVKYAKLLDPTRKGDDACLLEVRTSHVDDRGQLHGLQTVFPPSTHPSGERITWQSDGPPAEIDAEELTTYAYRLAAAALLGRHWPGQGARHDAALAVAGGLWRGNFTPDQAADFMRAICAASGDPQPDDRLRAVADTFIRGPQVKENREPKYWISGWRKLATLIDPRVVRRVREWLGLTGPAYEEQADPAPQVGDATPLQAPPQAQDKPQPPGHDVLQDRYLSLYPNTVYSLSSWWRYNGQVWRVIDDGAIDREIRGVLQAAKSEGVRITGQLLSSVRVLARSATYTPGDAWDTDPDLLTCQNGVLRISTGELLDHGPNFYTTSAVSYAYDPDAEAPVWRYFLGGLSAEIEPFLQEWAGYCLTTDTSHELAVWLYGPPGGGKSTYLAGLLAMLGKRAGRLSLRDIEQSRFALADLPGKTLVIATEQPSHYVAATDVLNSVISGEPVAAERKFRDSVTITPRAKICWAMNVLPRVDADDGLFRRVRVVKFDAIPEEDRDPQVKENIAQEGAGILNWALEGLRRLRARGRFDVPSAVAEVTRQFKEHNDLPAQFVADRCEVAPPHTVKGGELYAAYRLWCEANGYRPLAANNAAREWERLGFRSHRTPTGVLWYGLRVTPM